MCPRRFGHPNGRLRSWRITFNTQKKHWSCTWSLEELADAILAPLGTASKLTYDVYFAMPEVAFEHDTARLAEHTLSRRGRASLLALCCHCVALTCQLLTLRCQKQHLEQFRTDIPLCSFYDLSANCRKRQRTLTLQCRALPPARSCGFLALMVVSHTVIAKSSEQCSGATRGEG